MLEELQRVHDLVHDLALSIAGLGHHPCCVELTATIFADSAPGMRKHNQTRRALI